MYFMSDPQTLHVTRNVIPGKLGVDLHLHRVHIPLVFTVFPNYHEIGVTVMCNCFHKLRQAKYVVRIMLHLR